MQAAFFDLDKTIIARSSGLAFGRDLYREGIISWRLMLRGIGAQFFYLLLGADENKMERMREKVLVLTKGWERAKIVRVVEEMMGEVITPIIYAEALNLIREHKTAGQRVFIVSSSPEEIVVPLGRLLEADEVIASRPKVDDDGRYTGELDFYCYGEFKTQAILEAARAQGIDLADSYAYSDSVTDIPMLKTVGNPVAVNPDRGLRRHAAANGWEIKRFDDPITLRKRISGIAPSPKAGVVTGGLALTAVAATASYLWLRRRGSQQRGFRLPHMPRN